MAHKRLVSVRAAVAAVGLALVFAPSCARDGASPNGAVEGAQRLEIEVGATGYVPARIDAAAGRPIALVFRRTTDDTCGASVVIPSLGIERNLPRGESTEIAIPAQSPGTIEYSCMMDMMHGSIVVR
jgi:plastocyanin domain-containing protein